MRRSGAFVAAIALALGGCTGEGSGTAADGGSSLTGDEGAGSGGFDGDVGSDGGGTDAAVLAEVAPEVAGTDGSPVSDAGEPPEVGGDVAEREDAGGGEVASDGSSAADASTGTGIPLDAGPIPEPGGEEFQKALDAVQAEAKLLTLEEFVALYTPDDAPVDLPLSYDPKDALWFGEIDQAFDLTTSEKGLLAKNGFAVVPRVSWPTMVHSLLDLWEKDLPLLVTTDMILDAWHRSYDAILLRIELDVLVGELDLLLAAAHGWLSTQPLSPVPAEAEVQQDVEIHLAVARRLLLGEEVPIAFGAEVEAKVEELLGLVDVPDVVPVVLFGTERLVDFSQFEPRGHYEDDPILRRYFQAMMWLSRIDLRLVTFSGDDPILRPREIAASVLLHEAVQGSGAFGTWSNIDDLVTLLVSRPDDMDLRGVEQMRDDFALATYAEVFSLAPAELSELGNALLAGTYGLQQISGQVLEADPLASGPTPLPVAMLFLSQRYVVDSHVFTNVVHDRVYLRALPDPLDAMFALGNDLAVPHLLDDLAAYAYQGPLHVLRFLVGAFEESFWTEDLYHGWLGALRHLMKPTTTETYPEAMRTTAWHDKMAHTQLASWAQLRHDTILYAKPSYTDPDVCSYPDGFVEPYPAFYAHLGALSGHAKNALEKALEGRKTSWWLQGVKSHFGTWAKTMETLRAMSEKELAGDPFTPEESSFLKEAIFEAESGCSTTLAGWFYDLHFAYEYPPEVWAPTIADVHTLPPSQVPPGPQILHVGTADAQLLVFTAETCDGPEAYVGPILDYREHVVFTMDRVADSEWESMLSKGQAPPPPTWTKSFLAP